jgi:hypothetical protein
MSRHTSDKYRVGAVLKHDGHTARWRNHWISLYENKCAFTGLRIRGYNVMQVHHIKPIQQILIEIVNELDIPLYTRITEYTECEWHLIREKYREALHNVEGVCLCKPVHVLFHKIYGEEAGEETFHQFKKRWDDGEFRDITEINNLYRWKIDHW